MQKPIDWVQEFVPPEEIATESLSQVGPNSSGPPSFFKPVNLVNENGLFYLTLYACQATNGTSLSQSLAMWLSGLRETDELHLTVGSLAMDVPLSSILDLMSAFISTKAKLTIYLDQIVADTISYFYLIGDKIVKGSGGAMFIPSYVDHRDQDTSAPWKAVHDFFSWIVEEAVVKNLLTQEEADRLHRGQACSIPDNRFTQQ